MVLSAKRLNSKKPQVCPYDVPSYENCSEMEAVASAIDRFSDRAKKASGRAQKVCLRVSEMPLTWEEA